VIFGSVDCKDACSGRGDGPVVDVRSIGAFGSVTIMTESEFEAEQAPDLPVPPGEQGNDEDEE
jgi:hypothetical protein